MRILHLSDAHVLAHGAPHRGAVDTSGLLTAVVDASATLLRHDLIVVTGDITDDGTPAAYEFARRQIERLSEDWACPSVWVMGNHDQRTGFREVLGDGVLTDPLSDSGPPGGTGIGPEGPEPVHFDLDGLRVVALDTSIPQKGYGQVGAAQLAWLTETLAEPAPHGTLLLLHHAPLTPLPSALHGALRLADAPALAETIAGTDVRLVLGGHVHEPILAEAGGVPVIAAPAVANRAENSVPSEEAAVRGSGWLSIELPDAEPSEDPSTGPSSAPIRVLEHELELPDDGEPSFRFTADEVAQIGVLAGVPGWAPEASLDASGGLITAGSGKIEWTQAPPFKVAPGIVRPAPAT